MADLADLSAERSEIERGLWALGLKNGSTSRMLIDTPAEERDAALSPDGRWLAYRSNETGRDEVYVQAFPEGGNRVPVSLNGGQVPRWSSDSRELFFREGDKMMAVAVKERTFGRPSLLFTAPLVGYDIGADGRFPGRASRQHGAAGARQCRRELARRTYAAGAVRSIDEVRLTD